MHEIRVVMFLREAPEEIDRAAREEWLQNSIRPNLGHVFPVLDQRCRRHEEQVDPALRSKLLVQEIRLTDLDRRVSLKDVVGSLREDDCVQVRLDRKRHVIEGIPRLRAPPLRVYRRTRCGELHDLEPRVSDDPFQVLAPLPSQVGQGDRIRISQTAEAPQPVSVGIRESQTLDLHLRRGSAADSRSRVGQRRTEYQEEQRRKGHTEGVRWGQESGFHTTARR